MKKYVASFLHFFDSPKALLGLSFAILLWKVLWQLTHPIAYAWDAVVYTSMAKYIVSNGTVGLWEFFRPPLLPILFSIGIVLHIPVIVWAKLLAFIAALGSLFIAYKIGEQLQRYAGGISAIILACTPLFADFALTPTTEVFGVFGFLYAFYLVFHKDRYYVGGIVTGLLCLARFPYGLLFLVFTAGIVIVLRRREAPVGMIFEKITYYGAGVATVLFPYLISNIFFYGNPFAPLVTGKGAISAENSFAYHEPIYYYILILFAVCPTALFLYNAWKGDRAGKMMVLWISAILFFLFFTAISNKQDRFLMHVIPAIVPLAAIGVARTLAQERRWVKSTAVVLIAIPIFIHYHATIYVPRNEQIDVIYRSFREYPLGTKILSTSPLVTQYSNLLLTPAYDYWSKVRAALANPQNTGKVLYVNTCDIVGSSGVEDTILEYGTITKKEIIGDCQIFIGAIGR